MKTVPVIIPAYEPDERMNILLKTLKTEYKEPVIVVDDGSGDKYSGLFDEARVLGCTVLRHAVNQGKGRALKTAFNYCLVEYPDLCGVVTADSDGQHSVKDIIRCVNELTENTDSLVLGCRDFDGENVPDKSKLGNKLTRNAFRYFCGLKISDTQTGLRGIPKALMAELLNVQGERFEFETRMLMTVRGKYPVREIVIETIYDSKENHQTHFHPVLDSFRIYKILCAEFFKFIFSSLSSCAVDIFLFGLFCTLFKNSGLSYYIAAATVCARVVSAVYNYCLNRYFVFNSKSDKKKSFVKYVVLAVLQMSASALLVSVGCGVFAFVPEVLVKLIVDTVLFFISYRIQKVLVF